MIQLIINELARADRKHPPMDGYIDGLNTLKCEVAELEREVWKNHIGHPVDDELKSEAIQVAAMAMKFLRDCCKMSMDDIQEEKGIESEVSLRGQEWMEFSQDVLDHIETYTVPQYGDKGNDRASEYDMPKIKEQIGRYLDRMGTNARPGEQTRDFLKIAHYASMGYELP